MHAPDGFDDLTWYEDLVFYDGVYYGDLSISTKPLSPPTQYDYQKSIQREKEQIL